MLTEFRNGRLGLNNRFNCLTHNRRNGVFMMMNDVHVEVCASCVNKPITRLETNVVKSQSQHKRSLVKRSNNSSMRSQRSWTVTSKLASDGPTNTSKNNRSSHNYYAFFFLQPIFSVPSLNHPTLQIWSKALSKNLPPQNIAVRYPDGKLSCNENMHAESTPMSILEPKYSRTKFEGEGKPKIITWRKESYPVMYINLVHNFTLSYLILLRRNEHR